jgi:hypothetical protein
VIVACAVDALVDGARDRGDAVAISEVEWEYGIWVVDVEEWLRLRRLRDRDSGVRGRVFDGDDFRHISLVNAEPILTYQYCGLK